LSDIAKQAGFKTMEDVDNWLTEERRKEGRVIR
jgi:hypothetical protein